MKKFLALLLAAILAAFGCVAVAEEEEEKVLNIFTWEGYFDETTLAQFTEETGIQINYSPFATNEEMLLRLQSNGGSEYDIIVASDYAVQAAASQGLLMELDKSLLTNWDNLNPDYLGQFFDPENTYSVPYTAGSPMIVYDPSQVEGEITSFADLWDEQFADSLWLIDDARVIIGEVLKMLGYSYNTTDEAQIKEAVDLLIQQKPLVQSYVMDEIFEKMQGGSAAIGAYYYGDFLTMKEINPDLAFCLPEEGTNLYVDAMCIPKNAENKENAEIFINYMCSTAAGLKNCEEIWYSSPLLSVREELDPEVSGDPYAYPDESILSNCESFKNLPAETLALYDSEWTRLMLASN